MYIYMYGCMYGCVYIYITRCYKNFENKKEIGSQYKGRKQWPVRNGYHPPASIGPLLAQTYSYHLCSQMHVQIKHSLAHLQNLIPTLAGIK